MSAQAKPQNAAKKPPSKLAAKFAAWWNGVDYVDAPLDENGEIIANEGETPSPDLSVVENSPSTPSSANQTIGTYAANALLWGNGRISPLNEAFDDKIISEMSLGKNKRISIFGAETGARIQKLFDAQEIKITNYEADPAISKECTEFVKSHKRFKSLTMSGFKGSPAEVAKNKSDALWILLRGTSDEAVQSHIFAASRNLRPNGTGYWIDFFAPDAGDIGDKYANPEGRGFTKMDEFVATMEAAGLQILQDDDIGADFLNAFVKSQKQLNEDWDNFQAQLIKIGGMEAANLALSQIMGWRTRADALKIGALSLRKIVFCKS